MALTRGRLRAIAIAIAPVLIAVAFVGTRLLRGGYVYVSPLAPGEAAAQIAALQRRGPAPLHVLGLDLSPTETRVELQNPTHPDVTDQWTVAHIRFGRVGLIDWMQVAGPHPISSRWSRLPLAELVFTPEQADLAKVADLAAASVQRVALEEPAQPIGMHLGKRIVNLPYEHAGSLGWTVEVRSPHESARTFANAAGTITGVDLQQTLRARRLNLFAGGEPLLAMARDLSAALDGKERLYKVLIYRDSLRAELVDPRDPARTATYGSGIDGVFRDRFDDQLTRLPASLQPARGSTFAVNEVDWSALPRLVQTAREQLDMRESRVDVLDIHKRDRGIAQPAVEWSVQLTAASGGTGSLVLDTAGHVLDGTWPRGREPKIDMLQPGMVAQFMGALRQQLAPQAAVMEIVLRPDAALATLRDPHDPRRITELRYNGHALDKGFVAPSPPGTWSGERFDDDWFCSLATVDDAVLSALPLLERTALEQLQIPGGRVEAIGIGRHADILQGNRQLVAEISVKGEERSGQVFLDLRGRVLRVD